jgi:HEAT repeat protein
MSLEEFASMNEMRTFREPGAGGPSRPPLGEELLPPVEQPSARFIMQLFVVPALIVLVIVGVALTFSWLVRSATVDHNALIKGIESGPAVAKWQRASELADMLNNPRYAHLKRDEKTAEHLAQILDRAIDQSNGDQDSQEDATLRVFLARALGEFEVPDGTEVLLKAAETKRTPHDELVRQRAIEALAVRAYNLQQHDPPEQLSDPDLEPTLVRLAGDEDTAIRSRATFALGKLGTPAAIEKLEALVNDPDPDTRYNAALALAHRGNSTAVDTLAEMLDLSELSKSADDKDSEDVGFKRSVIISSAIDGAHALARQNPNADLTNVLKALQQLVKTDDKELEKHHVPKRIISDADRALQMMRAKQ